MPPLDGYGIIAPYLDPSVRWKLASYGSAGLWLLFLALWYIHPLGNAFWNVVFTSSALGIPTDLAVEGLRGFQFWQR